MNKQVERYTFYLPTKTHYNLKVYAAKRNLPISKIILELIMELFKKEEKESPF